MSSQINSLLMASFFLPSFKRSIIEENDTIIPKYYIKKMVLIKHFHTLTMHVIAEQKLTRYMIIIDNNLNQTKKI